MSLLLGGMTAIAAAQSAALKSNEIFISHADPETESDLKAAAPEEAPVSAVYPDGEGCNRRSAFQHASVCGV